MLAMRNNEPTIPVTYVDLSQEDEALVLATLDPIGALATADSAALDALLAEVQTQDEAVRSLLETLQTHHVDATPPIDFAAYDEDLPTEHECPKCGYTWSGSS
jgi:hypothetical protein